MQAVERRSTASHGDNERWMMLLAILTVSRREPQPDSPMLGNPWDGSEWARAERLLAERIRRGWFDAVHGLAEHVDHSASRLLERIDVPVVAARPSMPLDEVTRSGIETLDLVLGAHDIARDALATVRFVHPIPAGPRHAGTGLAATVADFDGSAFVLNGENGEALTWRPRRPAHLALGAYGLAERAEATPGTATDFRQASALDRGLGALHDGVLEIDPSGSDRNARVRLKVNGESIDLFALDDRGLIERWFADILLLHEGERREEHVTVVATNSGFEPVARSGLSLLARIAAEGAQRVTFIAEEPSGTSHRAWRLSCGLSEHYVIGEHELEDRGAIFDGLAMESGIGASVVVTAAEEPGDVLIAVDPATVDDRNCRWMSALARGDIVTVQRHESGWLVRPPDLPAIRMLGLPTRFESASEVEIARWGHADALRGSATGRLVRRRVISLCGRSREEVFQRLVGVARGDIIDVTDVLMSDSPSEPARGWTGENLPLFVALESVTLAPIRPGIELARPFIHERRGVVESINTHNVIGSSRLTALSDSPAAEGLTAAGATGICGVVVARPRGGGDSVTVWLGAGDSVHEVELPVAGFPRLPFVGDVVWLVEAAGELVLEVRRRLVYVRLLCGQAEPTERLIAVGTGGLVDGTRVQVFQAPDRPAVRVTPVVEAARLADADHADLDLQRTRVESRGGGFRIPGQPGIWSRWGLRTPAGALLVGEVRDPVPGATVHRARLSVREVEPGGYAIRRELLVKGAARRAFDAPEREEVTDRDAERWKAYLAAPTILSVIASADRVHLQGMRAPDRYGAYVHNVSVTSSEGAWIVGAKYPRQPAWAMLVVDHDGSASASYRRVTTMDLPAYARFAGLVAGEWHDLEHSLRFVRLEYDDEDEPTALFEFAYGGTLRIARSALTVQGVRPVGLFPLFHGDEAHRVKLGDGTPPTLDLGSDITYSAARRLYEQAKGSRIVHVIDVVPSGPDRGRITGVRGPALDRAGLAMRDFAIRNGRVNPLALDVIAERRRGEGDVVTLYAKLRVPEFEASLGASVEFDVVAIPPVTKVADAFVELRDGDRLMVDCGTVRLTGSGNDVRLDLHPLSEIDPGFARGTRDWHVLRRQFSLQENALRLQLESFGPESLKGNQFLASLGTRERFDLLTAPARSSHVLRSLLADRGAGLAIADDPLRDGSMRLEWEPGVSILLREHEFTGPALARGSVAQLTLQQDTVIVREAVPSEATYVTGGGRTALLLPKNRLSREITTMNAFAVGGLPNVQVSIDAPNRDSAERQLSALLRSNHIPVGTVVRRGDAASEFVVQQAAEVFGWLSFDQVGGLTAHVLEPGSTALPERSMRWGAVSFADAPRSELIERLQAFRWVLHDRRLFRWRALRDHVPSVQWRDAPEGGAMRGQTGVVFETLANGELTLRRRKGNIRSAAFPPRALLERADPNDASVQELIIASVDWHRVGKDPPFYRVYAEDGPGHVVELPPSMWTVSVGHESVPLDDFDWAGLGVGDRIFVRTRPLRPGELPFAEVVDLVANERGRLGPTFVLPLRDTPPGGGVVLGAGSLALNHPDDLIGPPLAAVQVTPDNSLSIAAEPPSTPFGAILVAQGETVAIAGFERFGSRFVARGDRGESWLGAALAASPQMLLELCGGAMPVTVERVAGDVLEYSLRWQLDDLPRGTVTRGRVITHVDDDLIVRAGRRVLRVPMRAVVTALPRVWRDAVARWLVATTKAIWLRKRSNGVYASGFREIGASRDAQGEIVESFTRETPDGDIATGVVVFRPGVGDLVWIRGERLGWARLTAPEIADLVGGSEELRDVQPGDLGLVGKATDVLLDSLDIGTTVRVQIIAPIDDDRGTAIARLLPSRILAEAAVPVDAAAGDVFLTTVIERRQVERRRLVVLAAGGEPASPLPKELFATFVREMMNRVDGALDASYGRPSATVGAFSRSQALQGTRALVSEWGLDAMLARTSRVLDLRLALDLVLELADLAETGDDFAGLLAVRTMWGIGVRAAFSGAWETALVAATRLHEAPDITARRCARVIAGSGARTHTELAQEIASLQRSVALRTSIGLAPAQSALQLVGAVGALLGQPNDLASSAPGADLGPYGLVSSLARAYAPIGGMFASETVSLEARRLLTSARELATRVSFPPVLLPFRFELPADYRRSAATLQKQFLMRPG